MLLCDLQDKLKKINDKLYIKTDVRHSMKGDDTFRVSGIYLKQPKRHYMKTKGATRHYASADQQKYLEAREKGYFDTFICGVCLDVVTEYDIFDLDYNRMLAPGWRTIALQLVQKKVCSLDKVKEVFSRSLGEYDYDHMSFFKRLEWSKETNNADLS